MRVGEAPRIDSEGDVRERRGGQEGAVPDFPDVVPGAEVEGRGDGLPCGAGVEVREFDGDVADAGDLVGDAELTGARGRLTAILAAHMRDAGADLLLAHYLYTPPGHFCRYCGSLFAFTCCG